MAKFFSGVFNYVFNELLVDTLANSRAFQRFAVRTDKALKEAQASGKLTDVGDFVSGEVCPNAGFFEQLRRWETSGDARRMGETLRELHGDRLVAEVLAS